MDRFVPLCVRHCAFLCAALLIAATSGCQSAYYAGLEKVGIPKRDLLERRVEKAQDAQEEVKEQFSDALERYRATVQVDGGELEQRYDALRAELESSEGAADALGERIESLKDVAQALFAEWEEELDDYESRELRASSERRLRETRRRYERMMSAMTRAHRKVEPVLVTFRDVVLAMKHALNAEAIAGLRGELDDVEREVDALVAAMNDSIAQAGVFLHMLDESATNNTGAT
jgi:ElaB/YqjD/DUF883 family membrane-anchored ribosome-binding protein